MDWERYRRKARAFLQGERDTLALRKLRGNQPLTEADLDELGRMLVEAARAGDAVGTAAAAALLAGLVLLLRAGGAVLRGGLDPRARVG